MSCGTSCPSRYDYYPSGMLTRGALYARAAFYKEVDVILADVEVVVLHIVLDITVSCFVGYGSDRACLVNILFAEYLANISVCYRLILACEVQVYVRLFIALESKEGRERNVEAFFFHARAALRTCLVRHVVADIVFARLVRPFKVPALRANIVRRQRIYFRDAGHGRGKRRTYGSSRSYQVSVPV